MNFSILLLSLAIVYVSAAPHFDSSLDSVWDSFKNLYKKTYLSQDDEYLRRKIWEDNIKFINKHNAEADDGKHTYRLKMNKYGDMHNEEFKHTMNGFNMKEIQSETKPIYHTSNVHVKIPDSVDWRQKGYVTPIKNQEQCGSCWAFSAVASLEGQHFKKTGKLVSLSEQDLVDCSNKQGNMGCNGGLMDQAFQYIIDNKGIDTEDSYPYEGVDGKCRFNRTNVGATMVKFVDIQSGSEADLTNALATIGPIAAAMDSSLQTFQFYASGIYYDPQCSSTQLDHGMTSVGYGSMGQGQDYYIGKNMWGTSWGMDGYVLLARNKNNNCGLATAASYPVV